MGERSGCTVHGRAWDELTNDGRCPECNRVRPGDPFTTFRMSRRRRTCQDRETLAAALHETARRNHNLGEGPARAICSSVESHLSRADAILAALPPAASDESREVDALVAVAENVAERVGDIELASELRVAAENVRESRAAASADDGAGLAGDERFVRLATAVMQLRDFLALHRTATGRSDVNIRKVIRLLDDALLDDPALSQLDKENAT